MPHGSAPRKFGSVKRDLAVAALPLPGVVEAVFRSKRYLWADSTTVPGGYRYFV
jgi:hypothetical protein